MARHLWREDIELRAAIRAAKDANPGIAIKELNARFGVSNIIVSLALEKSVDEWKALAKVTPLRARAPETPVAVQEARQARDGPAKALPTPAVALPRKAVSGASGSWDYRAIIVRGRQVLSDFVYEQQGRDQGDWRLLPAKSFQDALNVFGKDRWELAGMAVLSHGAAGFTGMYELVLKRSWESL